MKVVVAPICPSYLLQISNDKQVKKHMSAALNKQAQIRVSISNNKSFQIIQKMPPPLFFCNITNDKIITQREIHLQFVLSLFCFKTTIIINLNRKQNNTV